MTEGYQPLHQSLLSDQVFDLVRGRILAGELAPGERIVESKLARQLEVSQAPVRDGLRKLIETGLARHEPRRGVFVAGIDSRAAADAYHIRAALEPLAATELARRMDGSVVELLQHEVDQMVEAAGNRDLGALLEHDIAFHRIVWWRSGNELLPRIWPLVEKIWPLLEVRVRNSADKSRPLYYESLLEVALTHQPLLDALQTGSDQTGPLFAEHVAHVWSKIEGLAD